MKNDTHIDLPTVTLAAEIEATTENKMKQNFCMALHSLNGVKKQAFASYLSISNEQQEKIKSSIVKVSSGTCKVMPHDYHLRHELLKSFILNVVHPYSYESYTEDDHKTANYLLEIVSQMHKDIADCLHVEPKDIFLRLDNKSPSVYWHQVLSPRDSDSSAHTFRR